MVTIRISPIGGVSADVTGEKGTNCTKKTEFLDKIIGKQAKRTLKADYNLPTPQTKLQN